MARKDLLSFTRYTFPGYRPAWHHRKTADVLNEVVDGKKKRVMLFEPPRHGKSELSSRRFPAFFLGRNPTKGFLSASYNNDFASDFGREVRDIVSSGRYQSLFNVTLSADSKAANRWHTDQRGMYFAVGVGSATTGRGAHVLGIDDPIKNRDEADSALIREKIWRWYTSTAYTRLESDIAFEELLDDDWLWREFQREIESGKAEPFEGAVVLTMTRWHEDDLAGRLLSQMDQGGEEWEIIDLPAISQDEDGNEEALWPQKYPLKRLHKIRDVIGKRDWSALYQQSPQVDGGNIIKREYWNVWEDDSGKFPVMDYIIASLDPAYTEKEENDPSGFTVWGVFTANQHGRKGIMLMNSWEKWLEIRGPENIRLPNETNNEYFHRTSENWGLVEWCAHSCRRFKVDLLLIEAKASGLSVAQELRLLYKNDSWGIKLYNPKSQDKVARMWSVQPLYSEGMIWRPDRSWAEKVEDQMAAFPSATHDDLCDSSSQALRYLRDIGLAVMREEQSHIEKEEAMHSPPAQALYPV